MQNEKRKRTPPVGRCFLGVNLDAESRLEVERLARILAGGNRSRLIRQLVADAAMANPRQRTRRQMAVTE